MRSNKPYLLRALYEWINDNDCTPYLLVNAKIDGVQVPHDLVKKGEIVLNIKPMAVRDLVISNREIRFGATFSGEEWGIIVPMKAAKAVYAMENNQGMMFDESFDDDDDDFPDSHGKGKPNLRIID